MQPTNKKQTAKPPVSAHPAFPVIVALWFCALFGIGSMVLPAALLEKVVTSTGISAVVPSAAPPLGATARILIALAAAGIGVVAGLFIARKIAASQGSSTPPRSRSIAAGTEEKADSAVDPLSTKKPISAHEELGSDWFDAPFDDDEVVSAGSNAGSDTESDAHRFHAALPSDEMHDDALELAAFAGDGDEIAAVDDASVHEHELTRADDGAAVAADEYGISFTAPHAPSPYASLTESDEEAAPLASEEEAMADHTQATPFAATPAHDRAASAQADEAPATHRTDNILNRPLEELSIAGLVERFAHALETHRTSVAAQANGAPAPEYSGHTPDSAKEAPQSMARRESVPLAPPPPYVPSALRPIAIDGDDEGFEDAHVPDLDLTPALARPTYSAGYAQDRSGVDQATKPVPFAIARDTFAVPEDETDSDYDDSENGDEYSSLLTMKSPFTLPRETLRVDDEDDSDASPVAKAGRHDVAETEQRLREALEKLQRMSGAA